MTDRGKLNIHSKANDLATKYGISCAIDIARELLNEVSYLGVISDDGQSKAFTRVTYWSDVIVELNKLEY